MLLEPRAMPISSVCVVGAGTMGAGIAQKLAMEGISIALVDTDLERAQAGVRRIEESLRQGVAKGAVKEGAVKATLGRLTASGGLEFAPVRDAQVVIEAVFEDLAVKRALFEKLEGIVPKGTVLATNTSSFRVAEIARGLAHPERVVGLHYFFHPAKNRLVEVVPHEMTDPAVRAMAWALQEQIGKVPIESGDECGFVVNRFFVPWLNEAVRLHEAGFSIPTVERAAWTAFGISMGPFELMNVTGVPITLHATRTLGARFGAAYAPAELLARQVASGTPWPLDGVVDGDAVSLAADRLRGAAFFAAQGLVSEGVASVTEVEIGARVGLRWEKGPFELMNELGAEATRELVESHAQFWGAQPPKLKAACAVPDVTLRISDGLAHITFCRPDQMNALTPRMVEQLESVVDRALANPDVAALILEGSGKAFMAGADVKFFLSALDSHRVPDILEFATRAQSLFRKLELSAKPVVCKLNGLALGGGAELALACQYLVTTERGSIGFPEASIGIYPGLGGTQRLARRLGKGLARYILYTGNTIRARELVDLTLAQELVSPDTADRAIAILVRAGPPKRRAAAETSTGRALATMVHHLEVHRVADLLDGTVPAPAPLVAEPEIEFALRRVRRAAPLALREIERLTELATQVELDEGLREETLRLDTIFRTHDALEGMRSLAERRLPAFTGR